MPPFFSLRKDTWIHLLWNLDIWMCKVEREANGGDSGLWTIIAADEQPTAPLSPSFPWPTLLFKLCRNPCFLGEQSAALPFRKKVLSNPPFKFNCIFLLWGEGEVPRKAFCWPVSLLATLDSVVKHSRSRTGWVNDFHRRRTQWRGQFWGSLNYRLL